MGDVKEGIGDVIGVKCVDGEGMEFNSGDPMAMEEVSGADADDSEMSEISDDGEGVGHGSKFMENLVRLSWISSKGTDISLSCSEEGLVETDFSTGSLAWSAFGSRFAACLHSTAIDPLMIFSTSSSSLS